ncbi:MAG TPA: LuxR C-terminal-related transcriptional regulator [Dysgonamonadaceae bacterium]|nr:LuxR C-terminal-related transcriptional regulator [Dysgonamonadaceae bacterium]HUI31983.1 LuxR C-terminal-related transcriptional regulator [Dysgonamonadaceae bacterium]
MNATRLYAGMLDNSVEFFNSDDGLKAITNGSVINFGELPIKLHQKIKRIYDNHPEADEVLRGWFPTQPAKRLETFVKCRFGGLDFTPDISDNEIQDGEYWSCPLRGVCKGEGKICKPVTYNNHPLDATEINILRLLSTDLTNEAIGSEMKLPMGTLHKIKQKLYEKLNIRTRPEATLVVVSLNLL